MERERNHTESVIGFHDGLSTTNGTIINAIGNGVIQALQTDFNKTTNNQRLKSQHVTQPQKLSAMQTHRLHEFRNL